MRGVIMRDEAFEIIKHIGVLSEEPTGWTRELNIVSWNEGVPKWDIRHWNPTHDLMSKGITLTDDEMDRIIELVYFGSEVQL